MRGMKSWKVLLAISASALLLCSLPAEGMDTAFSYQASLHDGGPPANGVFDFRFFLYDAEAGGSQIGATLYGDDTSVNDGLFTLQLDFGPGTFDGASLWLEVAVRPGASTGVYTPLAPRQAILPSPYALHSGTIEAGAVGSAEVDDNSLTASDLASGSVGASEIATGAVGTSEVADNSLTASDLAAGSVGASEIATNAVGAMEIASGAVGASEIASGAVAGSEILDNSITSTDIFNGTISYSDTNVNSVQRRVSSSCSAGSSIRTVNNNGTVTCESDNYNAISSSDIFYVTSYNGVDAYYDWYKPSGTTALCFLTRARFRDTDAGTEYAECMLSDAGSYWRITANTSSGDDADAYCGMLCMYWYTY